MINAELPACLVVSEALTVPVCMQLQYQTADPYAVRATFHLSGRKPVEWFLAREVLMEGLHQPAGIGDVRLWPTRSHGQYMVHIVLRSTRGQAVLVVPARAMASFLRRTEDVVPPGTERCHFNLDAQLAHILTGN
ncbi:SsgA family sporulation/cell division regulator [Streptomyces sp. NPDC004393]